MSPSIQKHGPLSNREWFSPFVSGWAIVIPVSIHSSMPFPVENSEGERNASESVHRAWDFLCRAFASILRCRRLKKKPIAASAHRSSTTIEQGRVQKSHSCDITSGHLLETSESMTSNRTSCDSQRQFIPLTTQRRLLDRRQLSVFRHKAHPTASKSLSTLTAPGMVK